MEYGLQLYSIRDLTGKDFEEAIRVTAGIGYKKVEFAGFFGRTAEQVKALLDETGLTAIGTHSGWEGLKPENIRASIEYHHKIGCSNYVVPGADLSDADKLSAFIDVMNAAQPVLAAEGIELHYHNHSHEFLPNGSGQIIHEELQKRTSLLFEIDTYWAYNAGVDPIALMTKLSDRVKLIHIKDGDSKGHGFPLGQGTAPVPAVYAYAKEHGIEMIVESETLSPDGPTEAKICFDCLKSLEK